MVGGYLYVLVFIERWEGGYLNVLVCIQRNEEGISMLYFLLKDGKGISQCFSLY